MPVFDADSYRSLVRDMNWIPHRRKRAGLARRILEEATNEGTEWSWRGRGGRKVGPGPESSPHYYLSRNSKLRAAWADLRTDHINTSYLLDPEETHQFRFSEAISRAGVWQRRWRHRNKANENSNSQQPR